MTLLSNLSPDMQKSLFKMKLSMQVYEQAKGQNNIFCKSIAHAYDSKKHTDSSILDMVREYAKKDKVTMERLFGAQIIEDIINLE